MSIGNKLRKILRTLPVSKVVFGKFDEYSRSIASLQHDNLQLRQGFDVFEQKMIALDSLLEEKNTEILTLKKQLHMQRLSMINSRYKLKKEAGLSMKVVFLMEEPSVIKNMLSVIEELNTDKHLEVILVNLWYKSYQGNSYSYKRPAIESVIDVSKYNVIESYDESVDKWLSLERLLPDYVFFSRPYDYYRHESYHIGTVAEYARTCYVPYGIQTVGGDVERMVLTPECANLYYFFLDNAVRKPFVEEQLRGVNPTTAGIVIYLGYPGLDMLRKHDEIKWIDEKKFTVLWLPRWNSSENNCHFFEYKDVLVNYAKQQDDCRVILRPHPLCFSNFIDKGEMTEAELIELRGNYSKPNEIDEKSNYIEAFRDSSVLVADETSLIAEYFLTEKPIVFCKKETHFSTLMDELICGCYVVETEEELLSVLAQLKSWKDPLKSKRLEITEKLLLDYGVSAANNIKRKLWEDFNEDYSYTE